MGYENGKMLQLDLGEKFNNLESEPPIMQSFNIGMNKAYVTI